MARSFDRDLCQRAPFETETVRRAVKRGRDQWRAGTNNCTIVIEWPPNKQYKFSIKNSTKYYNLDFDFIHRVIKIENPFSIE